MSMTHVRCRVVKHGEGRKAVARKNGTPAQAAARAGLGFATRPSDALDVERAREPRAGAREARPNAHAGNE